MEGHADGLIIVLLGVFLALPLPIPTTNMGVAWPILLVSLGVLENDGLFISLGYVFALIYFSVLGAMVFWIK